MKKRLTLLTLITMLLASFAFAEPREVIDAKVKAALTTFKVKVKGGEAFLNRAKGYLVFPSVIKGGFVLGAEYGEGALIVDGKTSAYYSIAAGSFGFQMGMQKTSYIVAFMTDDALQKFIRSNGWEAGVDGSVAVVNWGAGKDISSISYENPIYAIVFDQKGLMYNLTLEGTKFTRINR